MKILINTTSPYARLARIALIEKGAHSIESEIVNPWADDAALLRVNPAARVPAVVTARGNFLTESLLIVLWLEKQYPARSMLQGDLELVIARAGIAFGVIEAAVHTLVGRVITDAKFDEAPVGLRRRRTILTGLQKLDLDPPVFDGEAPDLSIIATVVAIDYVKLRFGEASWFRTFENLEILRRQVAERESFKSTEPYV